jgi:hypothetical protein
MAELLTAEVSLERLSDPDSRPKRLERRLRAYALLADNGHRDGCASCMLQYSGSQCQQAGSSAVDDVTSR